MSKHSIVGLFSAALALGAPFAWEDFHVQAALHGLINEFK